MKTILLTDGLPNGDNLPSDFILRKWGDTHAGNNAISEEAIKKCVRRVKSKKHSYITFGGDHIESIDVNDKRFSWDVHKGKATRIDDQRDYFLEMFGALSGRVISLLDGNHERKWKNTFRPNKDIAKELGAVYVGGTLAKLIFPQFRIMDWHGWGSINSKAGDPLQRKTNNMISLKRKLRNLPGGDCELMASHHFHFVGVHEPQHRLELVSDNKGKLKQVYTEPNRIWIDKEKGMYRIPEEDKFYVCCGSALKGYEEDLSTYVEDHGYAPTELGCIKITVKKDVIVNVEEEIF